MVLLYKERCDDNLLDKSADSCSLEDTSCCAANASGVRGRSSESKKLRYADITQSNCLRHGSW